MGDVNNPPSLHRYVYAWDNPLRYVDPTGHLTEEQQRQIWRGIGDQTRGINTLANRGAAVAVPVGVGVAAAPVAAGAAGATAVGGGLGFLSGFLGAKAEGATLDQAVEQGRIGTLFGAVGGFFGAAGAKAGQAFAAARGLSESAVGAVTGFTGGVVGDLAAQGSAITLGVQEEFRAAQAFVSGTFGAALGAVTIGEPAGALGIARPARGGSAPVVAPETVALGEELAAFSTASPEETTMALQRLLGERGQSQVLSQAEARTSASSAEFNGVEAFGMDASGRGPVVSRHYSASRDGIRLHEEAQQFRQRHAGGGDRNRNYVSADVTVNGVSRTVLFKNDRHGMHSEQRLVAWRERMRERLLLQGREADVQVNRVYTERPPCGALSMNCRDLLGNEFGKYLDVYHGDR